MEFKGSKKWVLSRKKGSYQYISGENWEDFARVVVKIKGDNGASIAGEKNLKLIIAAPNLLNACFMAREELEFGGDWETAKKVINEAIEKALK